MLTARQVEALQLVCEGKVLPVLVREDGQWYARWRAAGPKDNPWIDQAVRQANMTAMSERAEDQRHDSLHDAWIMALRSKSGLVRWDDRECEAFAKDLALWARPYNTPVEEARSNITFKFSDGGGSFLIECAPPHGMAEYRALGEAAAVFPQLKLLAARPDGGNMVARITRGDAEALIKTGAKALLKAGYKVEGCDVKAEIAASLEVGNSKDAKKNLEEGGNMAAKLHIRIAGQEVGAEEIRFLLEQGSTLVYFRDRWIEVDRGILHEALRALERVDSKTLSRMEAVAFARGIGAVGRLEIQEAQAHGWLRGLVNELKMRGNFEGLDLKVQSKDICMQAPKFKGELRPYQARGVLWLKFLLENGFGALLADEMGLGKTIQTIAWICMAKVPRPVLVVAPVSLLSNWKHEFAKFAPSLRVYVHHGEKRHMASGFHKAVEECDVVLTNYALLVRDYGCISEIAWQTMVIDEAQTIKNDGTQFSQAVKALGAKMRIALTGTPIENSVMDLWSLQQFLNPGFLPPKTEFKTRFLKPLANNLASNVAGKLKRALEPFILRRLKTDKGIINELGEKQIKREYCDLTPQGRLEYEAALQAWHESDHSQGDIFALITQLKLVCDGFGYSGGAMETPEEGGKLNRLLDLLASIFESGESALVFTQYVKTGEALQRVIEKRFGERPPFMHGNLGLKGREAQIEAFNKPGPRAFILSLRTGGLGLNLVKANHVIHYDRWWNPAVEAQATDRAHRIGQQSVVLVHLFITSGTIEERVDDILEQKQAAVGNLLTDGERFLASMSSEEFERTVALE